MIALLLVVCLADQPLVCRVEAATIPPGMSCLVNGQQIAQDWLAEHPLWMLKGWKCRFGDPGRDA